MSNETTTVRPGTVTRNPDGTLNVLGIADRIEEATEKSGLRRLIRTEEWVRRCCEEPGRIGEDALVHEIQFRMYEIWNHVFDDTDDVGGGYTIGRWARAVGRNVLFEHERRVRCGGMYGAPRDFRVGHIDDHDDDPVVIAILGAGHDRGPKGGEHSAYFNARSARIAEAVDSLGDAPLVYATLAAQTMRFLRDAFVMAGHQATWDRLFPGGDPSNTGEIQLSAAIRKALAVAVRSLYIGGDPDIDKVQRVIERDWRRAHDRTVREKRSR